MSRVIAAIRTKWNGCPGCTMRQGPWNQMYTLLLCIISRSKLNSLSCGSLGSLALHNLADQNFENLKRSRAPSPG